MVKTAHSDSTTTELDSSMADETHSTAETISVNEHDSHDNVAEEAHEAEPATVNSQPESLNASVVSTESDTSQTEDAGDFDAFGLYNRASTDPFGGRACLMLCLSRFCLY